MSFDPSDRPTPDPRHSLGARAEQLVCERLEREGWTIVDRNARVGRLEIDVIARRGTLLVFCEVRARRRGGFVDPLATIDDAKMRRVRRAARGWLLEHGRGGQAVRLDAASVTFDGAEPRIEYVEDAF